MKKKFVANFWFVGWGEISLGLHIDLFSTNIEIHIPFGFIKIGFAKVFSQKPMNWDAIKHKGFGIMGY